MNDWPEKLNFDFDAEIQSLQTQLSGCQKRESELDSRLDALLKQGAALPKNLNMALSRTRTRLVVAESDARQLDSLLQMTSSLADDVSGKVRQLDLCKSRIVECLQRVEDALDLRFCTEGIRTAMANEDYEQAAGHVHRFLTLDQSIFGGLILPGVANGHHDPDLPEIINQDSATFEHQLKIMKRAEVELRQILFSKFDDALAQGDLASMERFFKLFPSINQHQEGIRKFGNYLKTKIADMAIKECNLKTQSDQSRSSILFADTLTILLENVARIFEIHQPLVENYYGPEYLVTLAEILQEQIDLEALKILEQFTKTRQYNAKAKLIDNYSRQSSKFESKEKLDPFELDHLLSEVTLLQTRSELYFRFIKRRITNSLNKAENNLKLEAKVEKLKWLDKLIRECRLNCRMQELIGLYIAMEQYYTRETLKKAVALNDNETKIKNEQGGSLTSALVDDVFYIIRKSVQRAMSSSNIDCLCAVVNNACALLETDFLSLFQAKIKAGYPASGSLAEAYTTAAAAYVSVVQQGKIASAATSGQDGAEKAREEFLTALNDADASAQASRALLDLLRAETFSTFDTHDKDVKNAKIDGCLGQLTDTAVKFDQTASRGVDRLIEAAVKQRVKMIAERLADHGHVLDDAQFDEYEAGDAFVEHFVTALDALLAQYKACLTEANGRRFFDSVLDEACKQLERCALRCEFNRLGALLFDKRIREITTYYADAGGGYSTREKFARLTQIASLLNVDTVAEAKEFYQTSSNIAWRIPASDIRKILNTRLDLPGEDLRKLKL